MTTAHSLKLSRIVFAVLLGVSPVLVQAQAATNGEPIDMSAVHLQPQQQNGITYLTGGIGKDESQAIQQVKGYDLHMTFSTGPADEYLGSVNVVIQDMKGRPVLSLNQVGPMVYVKLPVGKYLVVASSNGQEQRSTVEVDSKSARNLNLHWKGNS